jgi:hypothetical protein
MVTMVNLFFNFFKIFTQKFLIFFYLCSDRNAFTFFFNIFFKKSEPRYIVRIKIVAEIRSVGPSFFNQYLRYVVGILYLIIG